jgi:hypothetical protein
MENLRQAGFPQSYHETKSTDPCSIGGVAAPKPHPSLADFRSGRVLDDLSLLIGPDVNLQVFWTPKSAPGILLLITCRLQVM